MRWLRDNWIDALIFTVFAITVVGIVLFLTGVNPFRAKPPVVGQAGGVTQTHVTKPVAGGEKPGAPQGNTGEAGGQTGENGTTPPVTVVPLLPGTGNETGAKPPTEKTATTSSGTGAVAQQRPAKPPASAKPAAVKLPGGPETGVFRVSVGAFSRPENALALAEKLQKQGFPVRLEPVGRVTRVAVGPYNTRSKAAAAAAKLASYEPQVYRGDSPEPIGTYLQVGAYQKLASASGLVKKLRDAGIGPVVFYYQKPWLKVWVGPVEPSKLDGLKERLQKLGLEVVEVR